MIKPPDLWKAIPSDAPALTQSQPRTVEEIVVDDNMPCYKPEGIFSMRLFKPDPSIFYTMPVKGFLAVTPDAK